MEMTGKTLGTTEDRLVDGGMAHLSVALKWRS